MDEIAEIENYLDDVWPSMSASAQAVVDAQGVAYNDPEGELVTSIVNGKDCVFTFYDDITITDETAENDAQNTLNPDETAKNCSSETKTGKKTVKTTTIHNCCLCAYERLFRQGKIDWCKPISCALYPIREKKLSNGLVGITYNRWDVCKDAVKKGEELQLPIYRFLKEPLIRRFGEEWYKKLSDAAEELKDCEYLKR